jgi:hypothetical protein
MRSIQALITALWLASCARTELAVSPPSSRCEQSAASAIPSRIELRTATFTVDLRLAQRSIPRARARHGTLVFRERSGRALARIELGAAEVVPFEVTLAVGEYDVEYIGHKYCDREPLPCVGGRIAERVSIYAGRPALVIELQPRAVAVDIDPIDFGVHSTLGHLVRCEHGEQRFGILRGRSQLSLSLLGPTTCRTWAYETFACSLVTECTAIVSEPIELVPSQAVTIRERAHRLNAALEFVGEWRPSFCHPMVNVIRDEHWPGVLIGSDSGLTTTPQLMPEGTYEFSLGATCFADEATRFSGSVFRAAPLALTHDQTERVRLDLVRLRVDATPSPLRTHHLTTLLTTSPSTVSSATQQEHFTPTIPFNAAVARDTSHLFLWFRPDRRFLEDGTEPPPPGTALVRANLTREDIVRGRVSLVERTSELRPSIAVDGRTIDGALYRATLYLSSDDTQRLRIDPRYVEPEPLRYVSEGSYALALEATDARALDARSLPAHRHYIDSVAVDRDGHATIELATTRARGTLLVNGAPPPDDSLVLRAVSARDARSNATIPLRDGAFDAVLVRDDWRASVVGRQCVVGDNHGALCGEVMLRGCVER